jgi:hypothetical protein
MILSLIILYIFFFPISLTREAVIEPIWYRELTDILPDTAGAVQTEQVDGLVMPFKAGRLFGYADLKGRLKYLAKIDYNVTQAETAFINYPKLSEELLQNLTVQSTDGENLFHVPANGYPVLHPTGNRLFMFTKDSMGLSELSNEGEETWKAEFASLVTSLAFSKENVLVGLVNGKLKLFDNKGSLLYDTRLDRSQMPVILGCALSEDGMKLAGLTGLYPQKLFFVQRENLNNPQLTLTDLATDFRREVLVKFSNNGNYFFFEQDNGLGVFDVQLKQVKEFVFTGTGGAESATKLIGLETLGETGHVCVMFEKNKQTNIYLVQPLNLLFGHEVVPFQDVYIKSKDNHLFMGFTSSGNGNTNQTQAPEGLPESSSESTSKKIYLMQFDFHIM